MEAHDYDLIKQEEREEQDRRVYINQLGEFQDCIEKAICQANIDDLERSDLFKAISRAFLNSDDSLVSIELINSTFSEPIPLPIESGDLGEQMKIISGYTSEDLKDVPFENQIVVMG